MTAHLRDPEGRTFPEFESDQEFHAFFAQYKNQLVSVLKAAMQVPVLTDPLLQQGTERLLAALQGSLPQLAMYPGLPDDALEGPVLVVESLLLGIPGKGDAQTTKVTFSPNTPIAISCQTIIQVHNPNPNTNPNPNPNTNPNLPS